MRKYLAASLALGVAILAVPAAGRAALPTATPACVTTGHTNTTGILTTTDGEVGGPPSNAVLTLKPGAIEGALPDALSKILWLKPVSAGPPPVLLSDLANLSLRTKQLVPSSVSMPSYQIQVNPSPDDPAGVHFTTLVFEPYQSGFPISYNTAQTWSNLNGSTKWWSTRTLPLVTGGGTQAAPASWASIVAAYPKATVLAWGWDMGKGAAGTRAQLLGIRFGTAKSCEVHTWTKPTVKPSQSPTPSPSQTSPSPSATATSTTTSSASPSGSPSTSTHTATSSPSSSSVLIGALCKDGYHDAGHISQGACNTHGGVACWYSHSASHDKQKYCTTPTPTSSSSTGVTTTPSLAGDGGSLPVTGSGLVGKSIVGALALLAVGTGALLFTRRRKTTRTPGQHE